METIDPCPLCTDTKGERVGAVRYADVWRALRRDWGVTLPPSVTAAYDRVGEARSYRCATCGLVYFSPLLPGSAEFYDRLSANASFYVTDRWEFGVVAGLLGPEDRVIDFGAGPGVFVRRIAPLVAEALGVDHNPRTISQEGRARVLDMSFAEVAERFPGHFTVATAFHVLEHIDSAAALCEPAISALRPGGRLFLSTPNDERTVRRPLEPLDFPPHHVSRWTSEQYHQLARRFGLELVAVRREPFVQRHGRFLRALGLPERAVQAVGLASVRLTGRRVAPPNGVRKGPGDDEWPIGTDMLVELRKPG